MRSRSRRENCVAARSFRLFAWSSPVRIACQTIRQEVAKTSVPIGFPLLREPNNENNPPNNRDEVEELPPPTSIGIVQTPRRHRGAWQERRDRERRRQIVAHRLKSN